MITLRRNTDRRHVQRGKHDIRRTFYPQDPHGSRVNGFRALSFFDEIRLPPGGVSGPHLCQEAEVVTYVSMGALAQEDSTGSSGVIHAGEFQCMSTGRGVRHKERNASRTEWAHIFRVSLQPSEVGLDCTHQQARFTKAQRHNVLCVVASPDGRKGSLRIRQDAIVCSSILDAGHHLVHQLMPGRCAWVHIMYGEATLNDIVLAQGDGAGVMTDRSVSLTVLENTEILLVDLGPTAKSPPNDS